MARYIHGGRDGMAHWLAELEEFDGFGDEGMSPAEKYEQLGLADALSRPYDYSSACKELALILRGAYAKLSKAAQSIIFRDTLSAFRLLPNVEPSIGIPAANLLVQAAEAALPMQKKKLASSEFKHVVVAQRRCGKVYQGEGYFSGCIELPQDILCLVLRFLDFQSLINASLVCWSWNTAAKDTIMRMSHNYIIIGKLAWRSRAQRAFCMHCKSLLWLSAITCDSPHPCPEIEDGRLQIKPISAYKIVDNLIGKEHKCESSRNSWAFSSSESGDSDCDESSVSKMFSKHWAWADRINFGK